MPKVRKPLSYLDLDKANPTSIVLEKVFRDAVDYEKNIGNGFEAIVLTTPTLASKDLSAVINNKTSTKKEKEVTSRGTNSFYIRIIGPNSPHNFLPNPIDFVVTDDEECQKRYMNLIKQHSLVSTNSSNLPAKGDLVYVRLSDAQSFYSVKFVKDYDGIKIRSYAPIPDIVVKKQTSPQQAFKGNPSGGTKPVYLKDRFTYPKGKGTMIKALQEKLPIHNENQLIIGSNSFQSLTSIVQAELDIWSKLKGERDPKALPILKKYWNATVPNYDKWTTETPWSAAFISWNMLQVDPGFPKDTFHSEYALSSAMGKGGWTAWRTDTNAKIRAEIGDILVRQGLWKGATEKSSHGDVVYKIENEVAILAGGNLGNTAQIATRLPIDKDQNYSSFGSYIVLLKKDGRIVEPQAPSESVAVTDAEEVGDTGMQ